MKNADEKTDEVVQKRIPLKDLASLGVEELTKNLVRAMPVHDGHVSVAAFNSSI